MIPDLRNIKYTDINTLFNLTDKEIEYLDDKTLDKTL